VEDAGRTLTLKSFVTDAAAVDTGDTTVEIGFDNSIRGFLRRNENHPFGTKEGQSMHGGLQNSASGIDVFISIRHIISGHLSFNSFIRSSLRTSYPCH
jgi:hypothetical protein